MSQEPETVQTVPEEQYLGRSPGGGVRMVVEPFRLMTSAERLTQEAFIMKLSGLRRNQIAVNSWGFPVIPLPYPRSGPIGGEPRMAPDNVKKEWLGHPIYWIDPALTNFDPALEEESWWSIRMFYLIQSLGLWDENLKWIDRTRDVKHDDIDVQAYHQASSPSSALDHVKLLKQSDMHMTLEQYLNNYGEAMGRCAEKLVQENEALIERQTDAYNLAKSIVGDSISKSTTIRSLRADDPDSLWTTRIAPALFRITQDYEARVKPDAPLAKMSDMVDDISEWFTYLEDVLRRMNQVSSILTVPVLKSINPEPESFGYLASYIAVSLDTVNDRNKGYTFLDRALDTTSSDLAPGAMREVVTEAWAEYQKAWKRVLMALSNFERIQEGLEPFTSYMALEVYYNVEHQVVDPTKQSSKDLIRHFDNLFGEQQ